MRKKHNKEPGYIAERMNPHVPDQKVVIYIAADQGIDTWTRGDKYAVVCDVHNVFDSTTSIPKARKMMKAPEEFCLDCRELAEEGSPNAR